MHRFYVKFDGSGTLRFNWPDDPATKWDIYESRWPIKNEFEAMCLIEFIFDYNGYLSVLYSNDWEAIVIEEDHDN
jgi:hypothetical protein